MCMKMMDIQPALVALLVTGSVTVRAAWLQCSASLGSRPRLAKS